MHILTFTKFHGLTWALDQIVGQKTRSRLSVPDRRENPRFVAEEFSISEDSLMRLVAAKLDIPFVNNPEVPNPRLNLGRFAVEELKSRAFVIYQATIDSVTLLCMDPEIVSDIHFKREKKKVIFNLTTWPIISKLIEDITAASVDVTRSSFSTLPHFDSPLLWTVLAHIMKNVSKGGGSGFELTRGRKFVNYAFVDSSLRTRTGDIEFSAGSALITMFTEISFQDSNFERDIAGNNYSFSILPLPARGSVYINYKKISVSSKAIEPSVYSTEPVLVESDVH